MLIEGMPLPQGMEFRAHPAREKRQPQERRKRTDWTKVEQALYARPGSWARIAVDQPNPSLASNITAGRIRAFDPQHIEANAVQVQSGPRLYDIYARARTKPAGIENPTQQQIDTQMNYCAERRREWYDRHQGEWVRQLADEGYWKPGERVSNTERFEE